MDVSLLNINDGVYEVLGSCGNNNLGGSDFDLQIMEYVINQFIEENNTCESECSQKNYLKNGFMCVSSCPKENSFIFQNKYCVESCGIFQQFSL